VCVAGRVVGERQVADVNLTSIRPLEVRGARDGGAVETGRDQQVRAVAEPGPGRRRPPAAAVVVGVRSTADRRRPVAAVLDGARHLQPVALKHRVLVTIGSTRRARVEPANRICACRSETNYYRPQT